MGDYLAYPIIYDDFTLPRYARTTLSSGFHTPCPRKKQATLIFAITSPSVEIFLQFLKHLVQD